MLVFNKHEVAQAFWPAFITTNTSFKPSTTLLSHIHATHNLRLSKMNRIPAGRLGSTAAVFEESDSDCFACRDGKIQCHTAW